MNVISSWISSRVLWRISLKLAEAIGLADEGSYRAGDLDGENMRMWPDLANKMIWNLTFKKPVTD